MYHETKRLIKKAILENKLVVFAGAGVSLNSGIPLWGTAIGKINDNLESEFINEKDYLKIPQFYYNARGFKEYNELMKEIFAYADKEPNDLHRKIFELKPSHIITTNYDDFLEKVADENGEFLELVERDTDIPYAKNDRLLIKMHGGFKYDNYVLKEDDYLNYSNNFKLTETLIKSLIARYTILFIGYSFNDPDTKQILNWVKNSLGDDFQRAYMILGQDKYNQTLFDYYKNLGINLIFAERCLADNFIEDQNGVFDNTIECLNYFIKNDNIEDLAQKLYMKLKQYEKLNYIRLSYIKQAITATNSKWRPVIEGNTLSTNDVEGFEFWEKLMKDDGEYADRVRTILSKSQLLHVELKPNMDGNNENKLKLEFSNSLCAYVNFDQLIRDGNYVALKLLAEKADIYDAKMSLNTKFETAYYYYKTNQLTKATNILSEISKQCKKQKNYLWHFISEFNIKQLSRQDWRMFDNQDNAKNLQEIIFNYNLYSEEDSFLLEITTFSLFYYAYQQANEMVKKISDDNVHFGIQEIHKLEYYVKDIYNFMSANYLMIEKFSDIKSIFKTYFIGCLVSHFTPEHNKPGIFGLDFRSYAIKEVSEFSIMCAIEYCDYKELQIIFSDYTGKVMVLDKSATMLLIQRVTNYYKAYEAKINNFNYQKLLNNIVFIASKSVLLKEDFSTLFNEFVNILEKGFFEKPFITLLSNFIVSTANRDKSIVNEDELKKLIYKIIDIHLLHTSDGQIYDYNNLNHLFNSSVTLLKALNPGIIFDEAIVNKLVSGVGKLQFISIFDLCDKKAKKAIKAHINANVRLNTEMYLDALRLDIITPDIEVENIILSNLSNLHESQKPGETKVYPDPYETALTGVINLKMSNNLLQVDKFKPFLSESPNVFSFLGDMDHFDYKQFDLDWVVNFGFSKQLLKLISENPVAKLNIAEKFKEKYSTVQLDKSELDIFFNYFF